MISCQAIMASNQRSFYDFSYAELATLFKENGVSEYATSLLFNWHYKQKKIESCQHHNLSKKAKEIVNQFSFDLGKITYIQQAEDSTVKFLITFHDGLSVESVLIPFQNKYSVCLSTQVGCAMKCSFCFTGTQGLKRHLTTSEIMGQFLLVWNWLIENRPDDQMIKSIVFMGQGEPLHNFDAVKKACEIFKDQHGISLAAQRITISTAGYLPGLRRWIEEIPGVNLALSLHSVVEEKRNRLIPINQKYNLKELLDYITKIPLAKKQYIIYEYLLIDGLNDTLEDAHLTGQLLQNTQSIINLIPFNPFPGSEFKRSKDESIVLFKETIESYGLPALIRTTKGDDILAACGQLNTKVQNV